jgi:hypothetical protein
MSQTYHRSVSITNSAGNHIRYIPGSLAGAMVQQGAATPIETAGKVRSVTLAVSAATHAHRIGEPSSTASMGQVHQMAQAGHPATRVIEHHQRCLY